MKRKRKQFIQHVGQVAVAACVVDLDGNVPTEIQLTPAGLFRARDGRPHGVAGWYIDAQVASGGPLAYAARVQDDFVIDYEHQTLYTKENGKPAPAAGWWREFEWREGAGLFAVNVEWTENAAASIKAKEYRYISPVIAFDPETGRVLAVIMAALTNYAAIDGMQELSALAAAHFQFTTEEETVNEALLKLLGLNKDASDEQIEAAITALKAQSAVATAVRASLGIDDEGDAVQAIAALKTAGGEADPSKYVPIDTVKKMQTEIADLTAKVNGNEVDNLVDVAMSEGKLLPAQEDWARKLGESDIEALKSYIETAQPVAALKGNQTGGKAPEGEGGDGELSDAELAVCKATGIDVEEYKKTKTAAA